MSDSGRAVMGWTQQHRPRVSITGQTHQNHPRVSIPGETRENRPRVSPHPRVSPASPRHPDSPAALPRGDRTHSDRPHSALPHRSAGPRGRFSWPEPTNPRRVRRRTRIWLFGVLAVLLSVGTGTAVALWLGQTKTPALTVGQVHLGFAVTKDSLTDAATGSSDTVQFTIGPAEAQALVDGGPDANGAFAVAVPFDVTLLASAGYGLDYTLSLATADPGTVFALPGTAVFFPVSAASACTVAAAGTATAYTPPDPVTGLPATTTPETQVDHWCLVITVQPPTYDTTSVANGTNLLASPESSTVDADSSWLAYVIPDPAAEPDLPVTLTPLPVKPSTAPGR